MQTVTEWFRGAEGWRRERCFSCRGTGMVSSCSWDGFEGPQDCDRCRGNGAYWRTPKGRYVVYPGGPFV